MFLQIIFECVGADSISARFVGTILAGAYRMRPYGVAV